MRRIELASPDESTTTNHDNQAPGRRTLTGALQMRAQSTEAPASSGGPITLPDGLRGDPGAVAADGVAGASAPLPHQATIQQAFGHHDVGGVRAQVGGPAREASDRLGAVAYATGDSVAFGAEPDLHTAAHEAAHVVQQRAGVHLKGGVGQVGDPYEQHADAVADRVVRGESAQALLDQVAAPDSRGGTTGVQLSAREVAARHVGPRFHTYNRDEYGEFLGPQPGEQLLSGQVRLDATATVQPSSDLTRDLGISAGGESGGTTGGAIRDRVASGAVPAVSNATGVSASAGARGRGVVAASVVMRNLANSLVENGNPVTLQGEGDYARATVNDPFQARVWSSSYLLLRRVSLTVSGQHSLSTAADGEYLWTQLVPEVEPVWERVMQSMDGGGMQEILTGAQMPARVALYAHMRSNLFGGNVDSWIRSTVRRPQQHDTPLQNLQRYTAMGLTQANADLGIYVQAARRLLDAPGESEDFKAALRARLADGPFPALAAINLAPAPTSTAGGFGAFPADPTLSTSTGTTDASFDLFRLSGRSRAHTELIATLTGTLDPVGFVDAYPVERDGYCAPRLMDGVISEAMSISARVSHFLDRVQLATPSSQLTQSQLVDEAMALGAFEAVRDWALNLHGNSALARQFGVHNALVNFHARAAAPAAAGGAHLSLSSAASRAATEMLQAVQVNGAELWRAGLGRRDAPGVAAASPEWKRGDALQQVGHVIQTTAIGNDLNGLRRAVSSAAVAIVAQATLGDLTTLLAGQAGTAQASTVTAFEAAHLRYSAELMSGLDRAARSNEDARQVRAAWSQRLKGVKEVLSLIPAGVELAQWGDSLRGNLQGAMRVLKFAGAALGIAAWGFDFVVFLHNRSVRETNARETARIRHEAQQALANYRTGGLAGVSARAAEANSVYASGHVWDGDSMEQSVAALAGDPPGHVSHGRQINLHSFENDPAALQALYQAALRSNAVAYNDIYRGMYQAIDTALHDDAERWLAALAALEDTVS